MDAPRLIDALERFVGALGSVVAGVGAEDALWRPDAGTWSILEIVRHLGDEEVGDFRPRLERTLRDPAERWDPIDPEGWVVSRNYRDGALDDAVKRFVDERRRSVAWLRGLEAPDWSARHEHPALGPMTAGSLIVSWAAHDALHLRQIARRLYEIIRRDGAGYDSRYAGSW